MTTGRGADVVDDRALTIVTDGSRFSSPQRGGAGMRFVSVNADGEEQVHEEFLPPTKGATNNQMELEATSVRARIRGGPARTVPALPVRQGRYPHELETRAESVDRAVYQWSQNRCTKSGGGAVLNIRDGKRLRRTLRCYHRERRKRVRVEWIPDKKGTHAKSVDRLAKASANSQMQPPQRTTPQPDFSLLPGPPRSRGCRMNKAAA